MDTNPRIGLSVFGETLSMGISTQAQMNTLEKDLDLKDEKISEADQADLGISKTSTAWIHYFPALSLSLLL